MLNIRYVASCRACTVSLTSGDYTDCIANILLVGTETGCFDNSDESIDMCAYLSCGDHGTCLIESDLAGCECEDLYSGSVCDECELPSLVYPNCELTAEDEDVPLNENVATINIVWGVTGATYVDDVVSDSELSVAVYDTSFNLTDPNAQVHLVLACDYIRNSSMLVQQVEGSYTCIMNDFRDW